METSRLVEELPMLDTGGRKMEVLAFLRSADRPQPAAVVARGVGLHVNTARVHLESLVEAGLAQRSNEPRKRPGRPQVLYTSTGPIPGRRGYQLLAEIFTGVLVGLDNGMSLAEQAGVEWGQHLIERPPPSKRLSSNEAVARVSAMMDDLGFAPSPEPVDAGFELTLRNCAFREIAEEHTDVVCAVHLGMIQGALGALRSHVRAESLDPFVTPHLCRAQLTVKPNTAK